MTPSSFMEFVFVESALRYAAKKWPVIPLHSINEIGQCTCSKVDCSRAGKHPRTPNGLKDATTSEDLIRAWGRQYPDSNIGIVTGAEANFFVLDVDPKNGGPKSLTEFVAATGPLVATAVALTGLAPSGERGEHYYYKMPSDLLVRNTVNLLPGIDVRGEGGYVVGPPSRHASGVSYDWQGPLLPVDTLVIAEPGIALLNLIRAPKENLLQETSGGSISEGSRNDRLFRIACSLAAKGLSDPAIREALLAENKQVCTPPLPEGEVLQILQSASRYPRPIVERRDWPDPLGEAALQGVAGLFVRAISPHTEADPVAILLQFLVAFGNVIGRNSYYLVEADCHYLNLFAVIVGDSSKARKGTSLGHILRIFGLVESEWKENRVKGGLSSGEGLIWAVRDPVIKKEKGENGGLITVDEGVADKRLQLLESEFANVLKVFDREGNTLSGLMRNAWDTGNLASLTKNSPAQATAAHLSLIGHITTQELRRFLTATESANGFGNRILWASARRSKLLPEGGQINTVDFTPLLKMLRLAIETGKKNERITKSPEATDLWAEIYAQLSNARPGLVGALTSRGEAQVLRLACIYALLDGIHVIQVEHLNAALALWNYLEQSCEVIFGETLGDPVADIILVALRNSPSGLTRTT